MVVTACTVCVRVRMTYGGRESFADLPESFWSLDETALAGNERNPLAP